MAVPAGKTPISFLQEYATKNAVTPQYDLIANEGAVHEPTFIMRVSVGDKAVATGKGGVACSFTPLFSIFCLLIYLLSAK